MAPMRVGVLAVQGNFREHAAMLRGLGADVVEVRLPEQLEGLDGLVIPGGESTAITRLMRLYGLEDAIRQSRISPASICLEITESALMEDAEAAAAQLDQLRGLGASEVKTPAELQLGARPLESARYGGVVDNVGGRMTTISRPVSAATRRRRSSASALEWP